MVVVFSVPLVIGTSLLVARQADDVARAERKGVGLETTVRLDAMLQRLRQLRRAAVRRGNVSLAARFAVESSFTRVRDYGLGPGRVLGLDDRLGRLAGLWHAVPERGQGLSQIDRTIAGVLEFSRLVEQRSSLRSDIGESTTKLVDAFAVQMQIIEDRVDQEQNLLLSAYRSHRNLVGAALGVGIFSAQADRAYRAAATDLEGLTSDDRTSDEVRRAVKEIGRRLDDFRARARSASSGSFRGRRDARPFVIAGDKLAASIDTGTTTLARAIRRDFEERLDAQRAFIGRLRFGAMLALFAMLLLGILLGRTIVDRRRREIDLARSERARRQAESAHARARDQLALTEMRFEAVFSRTSLGIAILDRSGTLVRGNEALATNFPGSDIPAVFGARDADFVRLIAGEIPAYTIERAHVGPDGPRWTETHLSAVRGDEGATLFAVAIVTDITERRAEAERLHHQARFDSLVDLPNRAHLIERLEMALREKDDVGGLAFIALDEFHTVVESRGQHTGDLVLTHVAERLRQCIEGGDIAARLGGSDFAVFFARRRERAEIVDGLERIVRALDRPYAIEEREIVVRPRIGLVIMERNYASVEELFGDADSAVSSARLAEPERYAVFDPTMRDRATRRVDVLANLRRALERDQLHLSFQPIVALESRRIVAHEVLLRWDHPELGAVSPAEFVPIAEESGLIRPIGRWVFERACAQLRRWRNDDERALPTYLTVNVSVGELMQADFTEYVEATLARHGLVGADIVLEITESVVLLSESDAQRNLDRLRTVGVRFSIDDFGTGFSSLRYLQAFRFDYLKIDQSFVRGSGEGLASESIVAMIVALGASLGVTVVAEGVETAAQAARLRALGARYGQGFYFGRSVSASAVWGSDARITTIARKVP